MTAPADDPAMKRFFALHAVRLAAALIIALGVVVWQTDKLTAAPSPLAGKAIFAAGMFVMLVLPALLRRRWRTRD